MGLFECQFDPKGFEVTPEILDNYNKLGYVVIRGLFDSEDLENIKKVVEGSDALVKHAYTRGTISDHPATLALWNQPGNDVTGMVARCEKVVGISEKLLGGEVYHYHSKLIMKNANTGGKHIWHQDYGYWYQYGCLKPDMLTMFIAYDKCTKENGCLEILVGSHQYGRVDHLMISGQQGADPKRVGHIAKHTESQFVELNPGDALFFHCNVLHQSQPNTSPNRRWALISAYNRASNSPVIESAHPQYTPLEKVPDSCVKECKNYTDMSGKAFFKPTSNNLFQPINTK
ncbi:L-proline trans-4-hydroxylase-like [Gigantopelta aegis]|uniref:L-proline trans-4-hydroxylase-like n=1 Tax=Gigantopelta aegis TaxID=1735272 RepID=UPI001B88E726|nr:L-proline trans-4-hydroxylase-like [Gigantopelta aegis]